MPDLFKEFYKAEPHYNKKYEDLIKKFSTFGGGSEKTKFEGGRYFKNAYEIYMYAAFLGFAKDLKEPLAPGSRRFWNIGNWKPNEVVSFMIMSLFAKSDNELIEFEDMEEADFEKKVRELTKLLEQYANGGLEYIYNFDKNDPEYFHDDISVISFLKDAME